MEKMKSSKLMIKISAVLLALVLWFYVAYVENPTRTLWIRNIPVSVEGVSMLNANSLAIGRAYDMSVDVRISTTRMELSGYNRDTVSAYVSVASVLSEGEIELPVTINLPGNAASVISTSPSSIVVDIEPLISIDMPLDAREAIVGDPASGCEIASVSSSSEKITVTGARSVVDSIDLLTVGNIDIDGKSSSISATRYVTARDVDGYAIEGLSFSPAAATVSVLMSMERSLPVRADIICENFDVTQKNIVSVTAKGDADVVSALDEITSQPFRIDSATPGDAICRVELIAPDGVTLSQSKVDVSVALSEKSTDESDQTDTEE